MECPKCLGEGCRFCDNATAMARRSDPATSHAAARRHIDTNLSERRQQVLGLVTRFPGCTSGEYARHMFAVYPELPLRVIAETPHKRLPELEALGLVRRGEQRLCTDSRSYTCETWRPV